MIQIGSLFSGIGGLELGLEAAFAEACIPADVVWQVERELFPRAVLARHWPNADRSVQDVTKASAENLSRVDVICGGFPCQDLSYAGKGAGLAGERSGLWFEYARLVRELQPRIVVVENVGALLARGIDTVLGDLAALGYDARWRCVRASDVGAPHRRERLFIVAHRRLANARKHGWKQCQDAGYAGSVGCTKRKASRGRPAQAVSVEGRRDAQCFGAAGGSDALANAYRDGIYRRCEHNVTEIRTACAGKQAWVKNCDSRDKERCSSVRIAVQGTLVGAMGRGAHGVPARVDLPSRWPEGPGEAQAPWEPPRTSGKEDHHAERLKALGNAVVPHVGREIGRWIIRMGLVNNDGH